MMYAFRLLTAQCILCCFWFWELVLAHFLGVSASVIGQPPCPMQQKYEITHFFQRKFPPPTPPLYHHQSCGGGKITLIWGIFWHQPENVDTCTACGACDKYEVWYRLSFLKTKYKYFTFRRRMSGRRVDWSKFVGYLHRFTALFVFRSVATEVDQSKTGK